MNEHSDKQNNYRMPGGEKIDSEKNLEVRMQRNEAKEDDSCNLCNCSWLEKAGDYVIRGMEFVFYKIGRFIGRFPWAGILIGIAICAVSLLGIIRWNEETRARYLWVPADSRAGDEFYISRKWFPSTSRISRFILHGDNVLTADVMQKALDLDTRIKAITVGADDSPQGWTDMCARAGPNCLQSSLLEIWSYDQTTVDALSDQDVLDDINTVTTSPISGRDYDPFILIGGESTDSEGNVTRARAIAFNFFIANSNDEPSKDVLNWEQEFLDICEKGVDGVQLDYFAARSFSDIGGGAIGADAQFLFVGYILVTIFLCLVLGSFNCRDQKVYMALAGLLVIGMSIGVSFGLGSLTGFDYGPLHGVLPFLLLGIGVDDMFVVVAAWENLPESTNHLPHVEKVALMVKHAGASILITSLTDVAAFLIGSSTVLPALRSFCMFAAFGIFGLFTITLFLFTALFSLNQWRAGKNLNACCCCYFQGDDYQPNRCSRQSYSQLVLEKYIATFLCYWPVKIVVIAVTLALCGVSAYGVSQQESDFNGEWFIPGGNYFDDYLGVNNRYFGGQDTPSHVFLGEVDYFGERDALLALPGELESVRNVRSGSVDSWFSQFYQHLGETWPASEAEFYSQLATYLSGDGDEYQSDVNWNSDETAILSSRIPYAYVRMKTSDIRAQALDDTREVMDALPFPNRDAFAFNDDMLGWEADKIIYGELIRNVLLAFVCVFVVCLILIANIVTCLLVVSCVILTLVDVTGMLHFWDVPINTISTIFLLLAIGLAVDYAAHIGHVFMTSYGNKKSRVQQTMKAMGTAVFNGGFSTFLAFVPLALSQSYVFWTFFQAFFLVSVFGLFHGLVFLPVLLSIIGPSPYLSVRTLNQQVREDWVQQNGTQENGTTNPAYTNEEHGKQVAKF